MASISGVPGTISIPRVEDAAQQARRSIGFGEVFRYAFEALARHPTPVLVCSLLCFAGAAIVGSLLYVTLILNAYTRTGSYFASAPSIYYLQMQVQGALGAFLFFWGRGAIAWIALNSETQSRITVRAALCAALSRWKPLLISSLIYGLLITIGVAGLTLLLREMRLDVSNFRWLRSDPNSIMSTTIVRSISLLPPDPGSPFTELYAGARYSLSRSSSSYYSWSSYQFALRHLPAETILIGLAAIILMFVTETVLCMRTAVIMNMPHNHPIGWLRETLRLSFANFWRVAVLRWGLRLLLVLIYVAALTLPVTLHQSLLVATLVQQLKSYWPYPVNSALYGISTALVGMVFVAFSVIYEAGMFAMLSRRQSERQNCSVTPLPARIPPHPRI